MSAQPKALPYLFLTEMWERYGFYVVQGLLILYMTQFFGFSDNKSYTIMGVFTALVYISPLIGGYLANNILGYRTAIIWGGFLLIIGYALMALPIAHIMLYPALATIIVGNGLFKPNISSLLGTQYKPNDTRRDTGFTLFYIGINIGTLIAGFSSGYIREYFGWHVGFAFASVGLMIGLITFHIGKQHIKGNHDAPDLPTGFKQQFILYTILAIIGLSFLLKIHALASFLLPGIGVILLVALIYLTMQQAPEYRQRMLILNTLIISSVVFWMLFLQMFYSANLFIERLVNKDVFGFHLTTTVFYASESVFVILLGPLFAWSWHSLGKNERNPSPLFKFILGILFAGLGFFVLGLGTYFPNDAGLVNPLWVFGAYLLITIGELLLSPIGLSAVTSLAPPRLTGLMMGVWFVATGFGGMFAGYIAQLSSIPQTADTTSAKLAIYRYAFMDYSHFAFLMVIALFFVSLVLRRLGQSNE